MLTYPAAINHHIFFVIFISQKSLKSFFTFCAETNPEQHTQIPI